MKNCPVVELLTEIRDRLRDLDTLEEQRRKDRERKRLVRGQEFCPRTKEAEKGKENFPPAPPIREKGKGEENNIYSARARARFTPPTVEEVTAYCNERHNAVDPVLWWNFYASKGWLVGKTKMVDWKRAVITWERNHSTQSRLDPKSAAFVREQEESKARLHSAAELAGKLLARRNAELEGGCRD